MKADLVAELRDFGCMPFEADTGLHAWYRQKGIDPSKLEVHNSPSNVKIPPYIAERCKAIRGNVLAMHELEEAGKAGSPEYSRMETVVRIALAEIKPFKVEGSAIWQIPQGMMDGSHYFIEPNPLESGLYPLGNGLDCLVAARGLDNAGHRIVHKSETPNNPMPHYSEERIAAGVDGELSNDDELALLAHIRSCDKCAATFADYAKIQSAVSAIESYDGKTIRLKPSSVLERILLYRNEEPVEIGPGNIGWDEQREGYEVHVRVHSDGMYEVIFDDEIASLELAAQKLAATGADEALKEAEKVISQPHGLFTLSWLSACPTAHERTVPDVLRIVFTSNVLEERREAPSTTELQ